MSITKTLVFSNISIAPGASATFNSFPLHLTESAEVTITPVNDTIQDGQTIVSAYDVTFSVNTFNASIINDPLVYKDTSASPALAKMRFSGATGGQTLLIENVFVNCNRTFDGNRTAVNLSGSKRTTTLDGAVTVS